MNRICERCGRPDADSHHKYCDACAHVLIKQYEAEREVMTGAIDRMSPIVKAKNEELEASKVRERKL